MDTNLQNIKEQLSSWYGKNTRRIILIGGSFLLMTGGSIIYINHGKDKTLPPMRSTKEIRTEVHYILDDHVVDSLKKVIEVKEKERTDAVVNFRNEQMVNRFLRNKVNDVRTVTEQTQYTKDLAESSASLDTACDVMATKYEQEIFTKDSTIARLESNIGKMSMKADELAVNNDYKDIAIKNLNRSVRAGKVKTKVAVGIVAVLVFKLLTK